MLKDLLDPKAKHDQRYAQDKSLRLLAPRK